MTIDLSNMGTRERSEAIRILEAWNRWGLPDNFEAEEVQFGFNSMSGYVFLTNVNYDAVVEVDGKLYMWFTCPDCGIEGTQGDFSFEFCEDCHTCSRCGCDCDKE